MKRKWSIGGGVQVPSAGAIDGNAIYFARKLSMMAVKKATGELIWQFNLTNSWASAPNARNSKVYFGSQTGTLYALKQEGGELLWKVSLPGPIDNAPSITSDGHVFLTADTRFVYAVSPNGTNIWKRKLGEGYATNTAVVISQDESMLFVGGDTFYGLRTADGRVVWSNTIGYGSYGSSAAYDTLRNAVYQVFSLYDSRAYTMLYSLNAQTGKINWNQLAVGNSPIVDGDGNIYLCTSSQGYALTSFSAGNGAVNWSYDFQPGQTRSFPSLSPTGSLFVAGFSFLYRFD
jgi:outer membrane protein assembly factor BamB